LGYVTRYIGYHIKHSGVLVEVIAGPLSAFMWKDSANYKIWGFARRWLIGKEKKLSGPTIPVLNVLAIFDLDNIVDRV
jgi:hypothetical protein